MTKLSEMIEEMAENYAYKCTRQIEEDLKEEGDGKQSFNKFLAQSHFNYKKQFIRLFSEVEVKQILRLVADKAFDLGIDVEAYNSRGLPSEEAPQSFDDFIKEFLGQE